MKFLVTGASGQVGRELVRLIPGRDLLALDHDGLDITDRDAVKKVVAHYHPDVLINAAAYTAVDRAESEPDVAFAVNRDGPEHLARVCEDDGIALIHLSTDYVFDGTKKGAYLEDDPVCPPGVYGRSKAAGEAAVQACCSRHIILRTSRVFSAHGSNFVKTVRKLGREREELRIIADQHGCPTSAADLATAIVCLCGRLDGQWGIYHFCQPEPVSWHGFADAIVRSAREHGCDMKVRRVEPIATGEYPTAARRPKNSVLNCEKIERVFGVARRPWQASLSEVMEELCP
ncbi:MAG: dTDP-4-dehydrorhamnose reductase [Mariprofundaceae bacterium]|nr:dTDP-4-dehydrorhamnose reductase [Mariprofundaceae bacterium]